MLINMFMFFYERIHNADNATIRKPRLYVLLNLVNSLYIALCVISVLIFVSVFVSFCKNIGRN